MKDAKAQQAHYETTLAFVKERLPGLTSDVIDKMASARHALVVEATGVELPAWEDLDEVHQHYERINIIYSLAASFSWEILGEMVREVAEKEK